MYFEKPDFIKKQVDKYSSCSKCGKKRKSTREIISVCHDCEIALTIHLLPKVKSLNPEKEEAEQLKHNQGKVLTEPF